MKILVIKKKLGIILGILLFSVAGVCAQTANHKEVKMFEPVELLQKELGLSSDQANKLRAIDEEYASKYIDASMGNRQKVLDDRHAAYKNVLTADQYTKYATNNNINDTNLRQDANQVKSDVTNTAQGVGNQAKRDGQDLGQETKEKTVEAGQDIKESVQDNSQKIKRETKDAWEGVKDGTEDTWDDVKKDSKETWNKVKGGTEKETDKIKHDAKKAKKDTKKQAEKVKNDTEKEAKKVKEDLK